MRDINELAHRLIGLAIEVHRHLGPGLAEAAYERALRIELDAARTPYECQRAVPVYYKGKRVAEYRPDLVVEELIVVEIKSIDRLAPVHRAQMLTYLRVTGRELGLVFNFNEAVLKDGICRVVLQPGEKTL
jgi:GxxExxY protein